MLKTPTNSQNHVELQPTTDLEASQTGNKKESRKYVDSSIYKASFTIVVVVIQIINGIRMNGTPLSCNIMKNNISECLETFMVIKMDAACGENAPTVSFGRSHKDFSRSTNIISNGRYIVSEIVAIKKDQEKNMESALKRWKPL